MGAARLTLENLTHSNRDGNPYDTFLDESMFFEAKNKDKILVGQVFIT